MSTWKKMSDTERLRRFKAALKRLGINPRELSERIGLNKVTCYNWHCGKVRIPAERLKDIEAMK
jgi:transposase